MRENERSIEKTISLLREQLEAQMRRHLTNDMVERAVVEFRESAYAEIQPRVAAMSIKLVQSYFECMYNAPRVEIVIEDKWEKGS